MKLISMTEFVLQQKESSTLDKSQIDFYDEELGKLMEIRKYAEFLCQPLTLEMFVPVDEEGNILFSKPNYYSCFLDGSYVNKPQLIHYENCVRYKKAQEKVLFKFVFAKPQDLMDQFSTIEDLVNLYEPELTPSALKQIGL